MTKRSELHVVLSDPQIPFQDPVALGLAVGWCETWQPQVIHLLGDIWDCYSLSDFDKDPTRRDTLQDEVNEVMDFLGGLRALCPNSRIIYSEGNHEHRLTRLIWKMGRKGKNLCLDCLELPKLLGLADLGIEHKNYNTPYKMGHLWFWHGNLTRSRAGLAARAMIDKVGGNIITGHGHKGGASGVRQWERTVCAWENPCLCRMDDLEWIVKPDWSQGFSPIQFVGDYFQVEQIRIVDRGYIYRGERIVA